MRPKEQFLSVEQCKHLLELGFEFKNNLFSWKKQGKEYKLVFSNSAPKEETIPTYSFFEAINSMPSLLPNEKNVTNPFSLEIIPNKDSAFFPDEINYIDFNIDVTDPEHFFHFEEGTLLNCAYNTLCWLLLNGYIK